MVRSSLLDTADLEHFHCCRKFHWPVLVYAVCTNCLQLLALWFPRIKILSHRPPQRRPLGLKSWVCLWQRCPCKVLSVAVRSSQNPVLREKAKWRNGRNYFNGKIGMILQSILSLFLSECFSSSWDQFVLVGKLSMSSKISFVPLNWWAHSSWCRDKFQLRQGQPMTHAKLVSS